MSDEADYIADALAQQLDEREYDSEGNLLFPMLTREDSIEILEQLCAEVGLTEFEYPAYSRCADASQGIGVQNQCSHSQLLCKSGLAP